MIDLTAEQTFPLPQAAKYLPKGRRGRPVHFTTLLRWVLDGVAGPGGQRVRLEALRLGGKWITSREALQRFCTSQTPAIGGTDAAAPRTPGRRQRASEKAAAALKLMGV
jgi:Protein of unknown function (DUF1580)